MNHAYVIVKRGKWLSGFSYGTVVGYRFSWTTNPFEARLFVDAAHGTADHIAANCRGHVSRVQVSDTIAVALRPPDYD